FSEVRDKRGRAAITDFDDCRTCWNFDDWRACWNFGDLWRQGDLRDTCEYDIGFARLEKAGAVDLQALWNQCQRRVLLEGPFPDAVDVERHKNRVVGLGDSSAEYQRRTSCGLLQVLGVWDALSTETTG